MISLSGYQILSQIYESANSVVYRAIREQDNQFVVLKVLKEDYPTPQELTRYKQEYEITRNLNLDGIVKAYNLEPYQRSLVIILEDFGASSLKQWIDDCIGAGYALPLPQFLKIAIQISDVLGKIHAANVIHKDINPSNIVYNPGTGQVKIIDFGISTQLTRENPTLKNPNVLEGTLAYMSPEQTGRMNRSLDYRTDFYSLGVTFYELLTGKLPFETTDALELVHCHIAKVPMSPHQVNPEIPKAVSDIVMKLMAKTAEERYQSAFGIKADVESCLTQLESDGEISEFPLACFDISDKFQIPQKLYGREAEVATLLAAFERVATGSGLTSPPTPLLRREGSQTPSFPPREGSLGGLGRVELILIAGYCGIGKSALVAEVHKPITEKRGYFISGKFDQFQRNIPYSTVVSAFKQLVRQLLTECEVQLNQWREKLVTAFGPNGQVIIDVIPEVELIVGKQPAVPDLGSTESQNRFNLVFQNFIRAICSKEHPLVIFLDDLQWADSATLKLIELMMTDTDTQYLFLIGAYRDNEVNPTHPLMMTLEGLRNVGATVNFITLAPLALEPISQLIADTLHSDIASVKPLASLIVRKTGGNPFFVNEFLKALYAENLLTFNFPQSLLTSPTARSSGGVQEESLNPPPCLGGVRGGFWQWNLAQIEAKGITDNVVELMIGKVKKLPESTQQVLRSCACVGASFDLNTLSIISEKSRTEISLELTPAVQSGLILPTSEFNEKLLIQNYKFLHDRVQQAAYALIDEEQKQVVHLQIGRLLLQNITPSPLSEEIFEIVDHLNLGVELVTSQQERDEIAKLNLFAGQKAKAATAYAAAIKYFYVGREILSANSWQNSYDLTLAIHEEAVQAAYLNGDFIAMEQLALVVLNHAKTVLEKVKVYDVKIQAAGAQGNFKEAITIGLVVLKLLGVILPEEPSQLDIQRGFQETASLYAGQEIEELINLPEMTEPVPQAAIYILSSISAAAYIAAPELMLLIVSSMVNLSLKYGHGTWSAFSYAAYGLILCGVVQDIELGYKFGKLSLSLTKRLNTKRGKARAFEVLGAHVMHWKEHFRETLPIVSEGYQSGVETGEFEFAGYCAFFVCDHSYFIGHELTALEQKMATYGNAISQIRRENPFNWVAMFRQAVLNLLGRSKNTNRLIGDVFNEEQWLPLAIQANDRLGIHLLYLNKLILCYLFSQEHQAVQNAVIAEQYLDGVTAMVVVPLFHFYDSLAHLGVFVDASNSEKQALLNRVNTNQEKMQKWAHHAPMNHLHKFYLVEAEKARVLGQVLEAEEFYERAIAGASENEYIQEEALAYELAAKFYLERGRLKIAQTYMKEAHYAYTRWEALAKVEALEAKYPQLLPKSSATKTITSTSTTVTNFTSGSQSASALDLATVMKASQVISGEIVLDKLLANLMKILIENAGAQCGYLILPSQAELGKGDGNWVIQASGAVDSDNFTVLQSIPIESVEAHGCTHLPVSIINYVIRTHETVVKEDAVRQGKFTNDPYIKQHQTKSILCIPLLDRTKLSGILYLENNLTTNAFIKDRVELLKLLSAQVAISIENAQLYTNLQRFNENLEQLVQQRTTELSQTLADLQSTQTKLVESEKMASLGGLVAGVAHEINTPVGIGITAASLLADKTTEFFDTYKSGQMKRSQLEKFLDTAMQSSSMVLSNLNRAADLIQSFKQVAVDQCTEEQRTFNLKQYLSEVLISLKPKLRTTQHQVEIKGDEAIALNTYPGALAQIITNLVMNSLTHAYRPEDAGYLVFDFKQKGEQIIFEYADDGKGIPKENLSKIFDPFFTTKRGQGGSGLGLHIVYNLVTQKLNGTIECESQVGVGTKFVIKLPSQVRT
ncbi:MAG: trifunctional serine/threonine-protein kinase/ATP-binding protein/sensor histidine kinase [Cyanobacteriota bacterium]|nr:trifunctional serine/threonine-protein kinase/ATP-binding protein/sensor histidine kinase [Cyanobacteriota bacterium]